MGAEHASLLAEMREVGEVVVVDADAARAESVAARVGGRAAGLEDALDAADAAVVATPADTHAAVVDAAIARGLPILCEKPLTHDLASSIDLARHVEVAGATLQLGFHRRHDPGYAAARTAVVDGTVGRIRLLHLTASDPRGAGRPASEWPEGDAAPLFLHSSIHDFDFARWMSGEEVVEVSAEGSGRHDPRPADPRGIETAVVTMRLESGALAVLEATWLHPTGYDNRVEVIGDGGHVTVGLSSRTPAHHLEWPGSDDTHAWTGYIERFEPAYRAELRSFVATCRGEAPPASTARDGLEAMRIAVAATRSYSERRPVAVDEIPGLAGAEVA
jgi:myo-inositol 2-dehydrogenase/D-chiro-inositol 1-dehydrogenase